MQHFKDLFIKLQTIDIKVSERKTVREGREQTIKFYDISHQNPHLNAAYKNELTEIKELAITDILNLPVEQIRFQLARLNDLKKKLEAFWDRYYHRPSRIDSEDESYVLFHLNLNELFISPAFSTLDYAEATMYFIDDLECTIRHRQAVLKDFEQTISNIINSNKGPVTSPIAECVPTRIRSRPVFKEETADQFFKILKEYFDPEEQQSLQNLLTSNSFSAQPLVFNGQGNQLADTFKQLFDSNLLVGCNKAELESWILQNFQYRDKGVVKSYTEKYLQDMISSNTKACQSPLFEVRRTEGRLYLLPLTRSTKNFKK